MTKQLEWTDKYWSVLHRLLEDNGPVPWYAAAWHLQDASPNITHNIADAMIRRKIADGTVQAIKRGNSRRKHGAVYVKLADRKPQQVDADDLASLRRSS